MQTITITSSHHMNSNRKIIITLGDGGKRTVHCYENERRKVKSLAEYLCILFEFFGCIEDLHIEGGNYAEVYNTLYDIKIPEHYVFINKGYKHLQERPEFIRFRSFYDFMEKFGIKPHESEIMWYNKTRGVNYDFGTCPYFCYPDGITCHISDIGVFEGRHFVEVYSEMKSCRF